MNSQEKAEKFLEELKYEQALDNQLKEQHKKVYQLMVDLHDSMIEEDLHSLEIEDGNEVIKFSPDNKKGFKLTGEYAGLQWDYSEIWFKWLKSIGEDGLIKVKETVHPQTRESFLSEYVENGNNLPEFIEETASPIIKYNKSAIKRMMSEGKNVD